MFMFGRKKDQKKGEGFTLLEVLVVISVVCIIFGTLLIAINPRALLQKSRDAKRMQDLDAMFKAINLALADGEITLTPTVECSDCTSSTGSPDADGTGYIKFNIVAGKQGLVRYGIDRLPLDPLNRNANVYSFGSTATGFEIDTVLENPDNAPKMSTDGGSDINKYEVGTNLKIL